MLGPKDIIKDVDHIKQKFGYVLRDPSDFWDLPVLRIESIDAPFELFSAPITPIPIMHGKCHIFGYRVGNIAYLTDVSAIPEESFAFLENLDILLIDCLREAAHPTHINIEQSLAYISRINAKRSYLIHMTHEIEYASLTNKLPKDVFVGNVKAAVTLMEWLLLLDLKDLRALLQYVGDNAKEFTTEYGNVSAASIGAIQRGLLALEQQGGDSFFGEPALDLMDFIQTDGNGKGMINILVADKLMMAPKLYGTFLLWLLSELWERLPEVGDVDKPKMLFFFDEAHLLFDDAPAALIDKIEQVVRLVRSKGVGVYFVTQNPLDVPVKVLAQLSNRVQHALRAFTPLDQKSVKVAAETFRPNPKLNVEEVITQLGVGEALISFLDEKGIPGIVERAFVIPPFSQIGVTTPDQRQSIIKDSVLFGHYEQMQDRDSAYEILKGKAEASAEAENATKEQKEADKQAAIAVRQTEIARKQAEKADAAEHKAQEKAAAAEARRKKQEFGVDDVLKGVAQSATRAVGSSIGRSIVRGILGGLLGGSSSRSSSRKY